MKTLENRNLIYQVTNEDIYKQLEKGGVNFYIGIDATGDSMHIGHLMSFMVAKRLELLGNNPYIVIGNMTALIGDPSGKKAERTLLSEEQVDANAAALEKQIKALFGSKYKVLRNKDWLNINMVELLRDYGKLFNINTMMSRDMVKSRIETGISFTEFTYQILQAMDFNYLHDKFNVTLQIGGQDQWGNIVSGTELIRKTNEKEVNVYGITIPLLTKEDGTKFGKTESGAVWLDPLKTTPYEFYQYFVNIDDNEVEKLLKAFSLMPIEDIDKLMKAHNEAPFKREAQKVLAHELTKLIHGDKGLTSALKITDVLFGGSIKELSKDEVNDLERSINSIELKGNNLLEWLVQSGLASSNREAREFISGNSVKINDVAQEGESVNAEPVNGNLFLLKRGKKKYALIKMV